MDSNKPQHNQEDVDDLEKSGPSSYENDDQSEKGKQKCAENSLSKEEVENRRKTYLPAYEESKKSVEQAAAQTNIEDLRGLEDYTQHVQHTEAPPSYRRRYYFTAKMRVPVYLLALMLVFVLLSGGANVILTAIALHRTAPAININVNAGPQQAQSGDVTVTEHHTVTATPSTSGSTTKSFDPPVSASSSPPAMATVTRPPSTSVKLVTETPSREVVTSLVLSTTVIPPTTPPPVTSTTVVAPRSVSSVVIVAPDNTHLASR